MYAQASLLGINQNMETTNKKIYIEVPDPDELGYGIDGKLTRQQWQEKCKKMMKIGDSVKFNNWQNSLIAAETDSGYQFYIERQQLKPVYFRWNINYANNSKPDELVDWSDTKSSLVVDLTNQVFDEELILDGFVFKTEVWFGGVTFNKLVSFKGTEFQRRAHFLGTTFKDVSFFNAHFIKSAQVFFDDSIFTGEADFKKSHFQAETTSFNRVKFLSDANFKGAEFDKSVCFDGALFSKEANFAGKAYYKNNERTADELQTFNSISFSGAHFENRAIFNNRDFRGTTSFGKYEDQPTKFDLAPLFHNCKLFQGTTFVNAVFKTSKDDKEAAQAFNTLKLAMSQQQSTRDEQLFIKKELDTERLRATSLSEIAAYWLYQKTSNYGFSASWSFCRLLLFPAILFGLLYGILISWQNCNQLLPGYSCQFNASLIWKIVRFTLLQSLPPLGIDGYSIQIKNELFNGISSGFELILMLIIVSQKVIALAGWFLTALALRNLFKMK